MVGVTKVVGLVLGLGLLVPELLDPELPEELLTGLGFPVTLSLHIGKLLSLRTGLEVFGLLDELLDDELDGLLEGLE